MGIFILLIIVLSAIALLVYKLFDAYEGSVHKPVGDHQQVYVHGVNITLTDSEIKEQRQLVEDEFKARRDELRKRIQKDRDETDDYVRKRILDEILYQSIFTESDYERTKFMYNNGKLRSNEEVCNYDRNKNYSKVQTEYKKKCKRNNTLCFWVPFLIVFIIFCVVFNDIIFIPVSLFFGLLAGFIGMMCGYKTNIKNAKTYGISPDDPILQSEKAKFRSSVIGGTIAAGSMIHNTKKNTKELMDVDSWKKFN